MATAEQTRARARHWVSDEMVRIPLSPAELARRAGVDSDTVNDFLSGKRWPQVATRNAISTALGFRPESIDAVARGEEPRRIDDTASPADHGDEVVLSLPPGTLDGLSPADREEVLAVGKAMLLQRTREIKRRTGP